MKRIAMLAVAAALLGGSMVASAAPASSVPVDFKFPDGVFVAADGSDWPAGLKFGGTVGDAGFGGGFSVMKGRMFIETYFDPQPSDRPLTVKFPGGARNVEHKEDPEWNDCTEGKTTPGEEFSLFYEFYAIAELKRGSSLNGAGEVWWGEDIVCHVEWDDKMGEFVPIIEGGPFAHVEAVMVEPNYGGKLVADGWFILQDE